MVMVVDPQIAGISGDMMLSALVDMGADRKRIIDGITGSARFVPGCEVTCMEFEKIQKHGIGATRMTLCTKGDRTARPGEEIRSTIARIADSADLSEAARIFARSCIDTLVLSESRIHGLEPGSAHLHEVSGMDTIVDIIGTGIALDDLHAFGERVVCMPVSVGSGSVTFSHGTMSNPAGAVLEILRDSGLIMTGSASGAEMTTPTGACILTSLKGVPSAQYPSMKVASIGYGAGSRDFEGFSNVLKIVRGDGIHAADTVKVLETNIDDASGEILGRLIEKVMKRGAKDISIFPGITKKGRPTHLVSVICSDETMDGIVDTLVLESGTLGIRVSDRDRITVPRTERSCRVGIGGRIFEIRYKISTFKGTTSFKIESDDIWAVSEAIGKSIKTTEYLLRREMEGLGI